VVGHIFGILKQRFKILDCPPEFDMAIQACIPPALAASHNFIQIHDDDKLQDFADILEDIPGLDSFGELMICPPRPAESRQAAQTQENIVQAMWDDYQAYTAAHANDIDTYSDDDVEP
jgi:hypothetical protein